LAREAELKIQKMVTLPWLAVFKSAHVAEQEFSWLSFAAARQCFNENPRLLGAVQRGQLRGSHVT
jgi:hypothetical protein